MNQEIKQFLEFIINELEIVNADDHADLKNVVGHIYDQALNLHAKIY